nr:hypothetical protein [Tanacetum cinerariifolium]
MEHSNPTLTKILILDTRKFKQWKFRIQLYLQNEHYTLWEVIEFGDSYEAPKDVVDAGSASEGSAKKREGQLQLLLKICKRGGMIDGHQVEYVSLNMRANRYWKKTEKKISIQGTDVAGFDKSKVEESAPKALTAFDGVGWDWSYMANEEEDHALVAEQEPPTEFTLLAKSSSDTKIRGFEFKVESKINRIEYLTNELELLKKEKEGLDSKLTGFQSASKDLDTLLGSQWPSPNIESKSNDLEIKFVKAADSPTGYQRNWNNLKSQQLGKNFLMTDKDEQVMRGYVYGNHVIYITFEITYSCFHGFINKDLINLVIPDVRRYVVVLTGTPTEPHHTPSPKAQQSPQHDLSSSIHPPVTTTTIPTVIPTDLPLLRCHNQGEEAGIEKSIERGSNNTKELANVLTSLDAASILTSEIQAVSVPPASGIPTVSVPTSCGMVPTASPIFTTTTVTTPYSRRKGEEAGIEKSIERGSNNTKELANVLTSLDVASILTSEIQAVSVPPASGIPTVSVPTSSGMVSTASPIFTTTTVTTPYSRRKGKEKMLAREDQRMSEQIARDAKIARIHAEEELQMLIDSLQKTNETIAKYLQEYEQFATDLDIRERIELINDLVKYQDNCAKVLKYQSQQRKPLSKKQQREFYMLVIKSHAGWKTRHFKGMSLEEIREKFIPVWKQIEDFVPMGSKEEGERFKRKWLREDLNQLWTLVKETLSIKQATGDKEKDLWVEMKRLYEPDVEDQL